jgi:PAS domain S-box-containing protein
MLTDGTSAEYSQSAAMLPLAGGVQARLTLSRGLGVAVAVLGVVVLLGWWLPIPIVTTVLPGLESMKANTAFAFVLTGMALAFAPWTSRRTAIPARICASIALAIASLTLFEYVGGVDLGIDNVLVATSPGDPPMRMSLVTGIAFLAAGVALLLLSYSSRLPALLHDAAAGGSIIVAGVGALGLIGYAIDIEVLYSWAAFGTLAVHTAAAFCLLGFGLWLTRTRWRVVHADEVRIARRATALVGLASAVIGIAALAATHTGLKSTLAQGLTATLHARAAQIRASLALRVGRAEAIANRSDLLSSMRSLAIDPTRPDVRESIRTAIQSHLGDDVTAIILVDRAGNELVRFGTPVPDQLRTLYATTEVMTRLIWSDGIYVRHELPMRDSDGRVGTLIMEQSMPESSRGLLGSDEAFGRSSRLLLCDRQPRGFDCLHANVEPSTLVLSADDPLAELAQRAFQGQLGVGTSVDEQRRLTVGYAPIAPFGLVALLSVDSAEMYRPLAQQFQWVLALVALISMMGYFLVRAWVRPLAVSLEQRVQVRTAQLAGSNARLALSEHRFRTVFEAAPVAMVVTDAAGRIALVNAATEKLFGYSSAELLSQPVEILVPERLRLRHALLLQEFIGKASSRQMGLGRELYGLRKGGGEFSIEVGLSPVQTDAGTTVLATIVDLSERMRQATALREANAALRRSNLELERFAYVASHDLQTPMRSIASFAELLHSTYAGVLDPQASDWLRRIVDSINQLQRLIRDLLEYSRIGADVQLRSWLGSPLRRTRGRC